MLLQCSSFLHIFHTSQHSVLKLTTSCNDHNRVSILQQQIKG